MRPRYTTLPPETTTASGVTVAPANVASASAGSRSGSNAPAYAYALMCSRIAFASSDRLGYTSRNATPFDANASAIRRTSGAYRFEIGQSVLVKMKTMAFVPAGAFIASTGAPDNACTRMASIGRRNTDRWYTKRKGLGPRAQG